MGEGLVDAAWAARPVRVSEEVTGLSLAEMILEHPEELARTQVAQPALLLVEWLAFLKLRERGVPCQAAAGHSLGEYAALAAAEVFTWEEAMSLVSVRGRVMEEAAHACPGGMLAVLGLAVAGVEALAAEAGCEVANYNAPEQTVLAGDKGALERAAELAKERGGKAVPLAVGGAFHTARMAAAEEKLARDIEAVRFSRPACPFVSGVSGQVESDPREISALLRRQMTSPVRWTAVMGALAGAGVREAVEAGPGQVLTRLGRMQTDEVRFRTLEEVTDYA